MVEEWLSGCLEEDTLIGMEKGGYMKEVGFWKTQWYRPQQEGMRKAFQVRAGEGGVAKRW